MKNRIMMTMLACMVFITLFSGCEKAELAPPAATAYDTLSKKAGLNDGDVLIVNGVGQMDGIEISDEKKFDDGREQIYIVPKQKDTYIAICKVIFENERLYRGETVYEKERTPENFVLGVMLNRAEGIPQYMLAVHTPSSYAEYLFVQDGKDGTVDFEGIKLPEFDEDMAFSYNEMGYLLGGGEKTFTAVLGEVKSVEAVPFLMDDKGTKATYEGAEIEYKDGFGVYGARMWSEELEYLRGVKIGDTLSSVMSKFPNDGKGKKTATVDSKNGGDSYTMLYGEYEHMEDYGMAEYDGEKAVCVSYSNAGALVKFIINDDVVEQIVYEIALA